MILFFVLTITMAVFIHLPYILKWDGDVGIKVLWFTLTGGGLILALFAFIYYLQFAIANDDGITIRGLFYKIVELRWVDIVSAEAKKCVTYDNRGTISLLWIILKTDKKQEVGGLAGENSRKRAPWYVIATKKNMKIIGQHLKITLQHNLKAGNRTTL